MALTRIASSRSFVICSGGEPLGMPDSHHDAGWERICAACKADSVEPPSSLEEAFLFSSSFRKGLIPLPRCAGEQRPIELAKLPHRLRPIPQSAMQQNLATKQRL